MISLPVRRIDALRDALGDEFEVNTDMLRDCGPARALRECFLPAGPHLARLLSLDGGYQELERATFGPPSGSSHFAVDAAGRDAVIRVSLLLLEE